MKQCPSCGGDCGGTKATGCLYKAPYEDTDHKISRLEYMIEVLEMQATDLRADRDRWKRIAERTVVQKEGMQLYDELTRTLDLLNRAQTTEAEHAKKQGG